MSGPLKLLYVDDEADIRTIAELALRLDPDMEVVIAESGEDALKRIGEGRWMPDVALIDMMMPGMSGMELLWLMRQRKDTAAIPVLFVTASARTVEVERYIEAGAVGVIVKPFDPVTLARTVREHYAKLRS
ncbi:MAG: response regulator [Sphingomonadales bacterium]|nr:response regulator [Sphingomonadales bacterium]